MSDTVKVLYGNVGYATGIDGTYGGFFRYANRFFYNSPENQKVVLDQFRALVEDESPDIVCTVEIERGSITTGHVDQYDFIAPDEYRYGDAQNKYGKRSMRGKHPFYSGRGNGFRSKKKHRFERIYLNNGAKRLAYRIEVSQKITLFMVHFSLWGPTRFKQIRELSELISKEQALGKEVALCGDFNTFEGNRQIEWLCVERGLRVLNQAHHKTFPSARPSVMIDVFLASPGLAGSLRVLPVTVSDHRPLVAELSLQ